MNATPPILEILVCLLKITKYIIMYLMKRGDYIQMTVTAKIQLVVSAEHCKLLNSTANAYRNACNFVSEYIFRIHNLK